jgi:hypothetical protein
MPSKDTLDDNQNPNGHGLVRDTPRRHFSSPRGIVRRLVLVGPGPSTTPEKVALELKDEASIVRAPLARHPHEIQRTIEDGSRRFHGSKFSLAYFKGPTLRSPKPKG